MHLCFAKLSHVERVHGNSLTRWKNRYCWGQTTLSRHQFIYGCSLFLCLLLLKYPTHTTFDSAILPFTSGIAVAEAETNPIGSIYQNGYSNPVRAVVPICVLRRHHVPGSHALSCLLLHLLNLFIFSNNTVPHPHESWPHGLVCTLFSNTICKKLNFFLSSVELWIDGNFYLVVDALWCL